MPIGPTLVARGRVLAERLMVDACTVTRTTGQTVGAGGVITPISTTVYTGACRLTQRGGGQAAEIGEASRIVGHALLQLPISAAELAEADRVLITASAYDPQMVGKRYSVHSVARQSFPTRREVEVIAVTS